MNSKHLQALLARPRLRLEILGIAASLCVHAMLFAPLLLGGGHAAHRASDSEGADASGASAASSALTVFYIDELSDIPNPNAAAQALESLALSTTQLPAVAAVSATAAGGSLPLIDDSDDEKPVENEASGDNAGHALMFGRYVGQITARIGRVWVRPRTPIGAESFSCLVQIEQDRTGAVKEITLKQCNGDTRWQLSLVRAIQSASPLPAPPDPAVFSEVLTLGLGSEPFGPDSPREFFEPEIASVALN